MNNIRDRKATIERGYKDLGYEELGRGYRFLASPLSTFGSDRLY